MRRPLELGISAGTLVGHDTRAAYAGSQLGGHQLAEPKPAGGSPSEIYATKWRAAAGSGLYVARSGAGRTPLLDRMIDRLPSPPEDGKGLVVEAAAGAGDQAFYLATHLDRTNVVAIDTSPDATAQIRRKRAFHEGEFGSGSEITIVTGDVLTYLARQQPGSVDGLHANSFWHFLTLEQRRAQIDTLREVTTPGGVVAVSFKAKGDGLLSEPDTEIIRREQQGILAVHGGIQRLFVTDAGAVAEEFAAGGLEVIETVPFEIPDYDIPGKPGKFVGILAQNAA